MDLNDLKNVAIKEKISFLELCLSNPEEVDFYKYLIAVLLAHYILNLMSDYNIEVASKEAKL